MEKRFLGKSNIEVSRLGLGCMSLGTDEQQAKEMIITAFEHGITYFDTSDLYDYGVNEAIVGKTLAPIRDQVVIATKVGNRFKEGEEGWSWDPSKKHIKTAVKQSLQRLKTDYIDLYQLHGGTIEDPIDETIEAFEELKSDGLIKEYGISSIRPNVIKEYLSKSSIVSVMMQYSLLDRRPEQTMELLAKNKVSAMIRGPIAKGILTKRGLTQLEQSHECNPYLSYSSSEVSEFLQNVKSILLSDSRKMNEIALQFVLANEATTTIVAGASSSKQIIDNINSVNAKPLTDEELSLLQQLSKTENYTEHL